MKLYSVSFLYECQLNWEKTKICRNFSCVAENEEEAKVKCTKELKNLAKESVIGNIPINILSTNVEQIPNYLIEQVKL